MNYQMWYLMWATVKPFMHTGQFYKSAYTFKSTILVKVRLIIVKYFFMILYF